jgi:hypothetical protein
MTATSEILTAAQIATLRQKYDLINASHSSDDSQKGLWSSLYSDLYDLITDFTLVNEPKAGVDPQSWLWLRGARSINAGEGPFAALVTMRSCRWNLAWPSRRIFAREGVIS